jgi:hypothetical protein
MPTTKHELLDWLIDVPEDAEIGTDRAGIALLAIVGTNVHLLEVGRIPNADELYAEAINQAFRVCSLLTSTRCSYSRIQNRRKPLSERLRMSYTVLRPV